MNAHDRRNLIVAGNLTATMQLESQVVSDGDGDQVDREPVDAAYYVAGADGPDDGPSVPVPPRCNTGDYCEATGGGGHVVVAFHNSFR